jgi:response regulator RpfG family c-di-GMP phosphodiesterase
MSDEILFAEDTDEKIEWQGKWKVLIVDDEPEVHAVTKLALGDFVFQEKDLEFISAFDGEEAKKIFLEHNDIAVVLLDVVMETDDAGLKVAEFIRNEANNHFTRIILRTGQPGQSPERDVIINYDINDYKSKTELTSQKLFTVVIAALRSYRDIIVIEENRQGLKKIISATADLFSIHSLECFIQGIVQQLSSLIGGTQDAAYLTSAVVGPKPIEQYNSSELYVFTGKGEYADTEGHRLEQVISGRELISCQQAYANKTMIFEDEYLVAYCDSKTKKGSLLYMSGLPRKLTQIDKNLVEIFSQNVQVAFDNVLLYKNIEDTQREIIERLADVIETSNDSNNYTQRMIKICDILGHAANLSKQDLKTLSLAIPLYSIGKIKMSENNMLKPDFFNGSANEDEVSKVRDQIEIGHHLFKDPKRPLIETAAMIAREHREHWNGKGYPGGKSGDNIHIFCRIISLADAFDAMRTERSYKKAWPPGKVMDVIVAEKGQQFDPKIVELLQQNIDAIENVMQRLSSKS